MSEEKETTITLISAKFKGQYANQTVLLPIVGEKTFDKDGNLTVSANHADALIAATLESFGFYPEGTEPTDIIDSTDSDIDGLSTEDLIQLAKDAGLVPSKIAAMTNGALKRAVKEALRTADVKKK